MPRRVESTEAGWVLAKAAVLIVVLGTLSGFTVASHLFSHASAGRIDCLDNQRATYQALLNYQAEHEGGSPRMLEMLRCDSRDQFALPGRCPSSDSTRYVLDAASGRVLCPNPAHRPS